MRDPSTKRPLRGPAIAFDKMGFLESAESLDADGLNMVDFPLGAAHTGPATATAYEAIVTKRLAHAGDERLAAHVASTLVRVTERGNVVVPARQEEAPNHAAIALVMAVAMATQEAPAPHAIKPRRAAGF
jgi:phage terminase large subunit-like protein